MNEQQRFLVAMVLSGIVIFAWQAFFAPDRVDEEELDDPAAVEQPADPEDVDPEQIAQPDPQDEPDPTDEEPEVADIPDDPEQIDDIDEDVDDPAPTPVEEKRLSLNTADLDVELSNRGGVVRDVKITSPEQYSGVGGELMRAFEEDAPAWPYALGFDDGNIDIELDEMYEFVEEESQLADGEDHYEQVVFRHTDPGGSFAVDKIYYIDENPEVDRQYALRLDVEVHNLHDDVALVATPTLDIVGREDPDKEDNFFDFRPDVMEGVCHNTDGTERVSLDDIEGYEQLSQHSVIWAGVDTRYFIMSAVPIDGASACSFERFDDYIRTRLYHDNFSIAPEESWSASHVLFMGPKDFDILTQSEHELREAVDYGLFSFLARPLRFLLVRFYNFTLNWGLAIILLTLLIKGVTWKITGKAYTSAERMKQIQPQIKEIREKYEDDQQRMTEETMKVFKENDVSPLGCLPLLLQMPILYGLFVMIYNSVELYQAEFLWYADLSAPDPFYVLPILMGGVMFLQQTITMSSAASTNPQMKIVMKIMPFAFTAFMLFLPAGLVLYYLLNLLMGLSQQFLIKRKFRKAEEAGEEI